MVNTVDTPLLQNIDFYLSGVVLLTVCILGLIANSLVAAVLTHKASGGTSTNVFLLALAVFDSLVLICTPLLICFQPLSQVYSTIVHPNILPYIYPVALTAQTCTIWITVSFTVERYIAVTHPLQARMCTVKRARIVTGVVAFLSVLYNLSRWFEYRTERVTISHNDTSPEIIYKIYPTELELHPKYESIYFTGLYLVVMCITPVLLLSVLNWFLVHAVRQSRKGDISIGNRSNSPKENNITIMLVSVVAVFIICQVPALVYNVAYGVAKEKITSSVSWQILSIVRNFMVNVNSAVNFILYCAFGQNFRKVFLRMFCKRLSKQLRVSETRGSSERRTMTTNNGSISVQMPMLDKNSNSKLIDLDPEVNADQEL